MEWVDRLQGAVVGLDTAPLIYYVEENPLYIDLVDPLFTAIANHELQAITSIVALAEVLVHPLRSQDMRLAMTYRTLLLDSQAITTFEVDRDIAERTAYLRSQFRLRTPDAILLATTLHQGGTHFVTNDDRLPDIPGLNIIVLTDLLTP